MGVTKAIVLTVYKVCNLFIGHMVCSDRVQLYYMMVHSAKVAVGVSKDGLLKKSNAYNYFIVHSAC